MIAPTRVPDAGPLLVLAAGGTGGHVFPAQAVAEEMLRRNWAAEFWTDRRGLAFANGFPQDVKVQTIASSTQARGGIAERAVAPAKIAKGVLSALLRIRSLRPAVVAGFGGYPAFPPIAAAWLARTPTLIHEQNGVLGRANKVLAKRVDMVACGAVDTILPKGVECVRTGNPVRAEVLEFEKASYHEPDGGEIRLLVTGGSQGAGAIDRVMADAVTILPNDLRQRLRVTQQVRPENLESTKEKYLRCSVECEIAPFYEDLPRRIADSHLVVSRSGASSIAEIGVIGRPAILIPFAAAANDHQTANAQGLIDAGAAVALIENELSPEAMARELARILTNKGTAARMAEAAKRTSMPTAAAQLADAIECLAEKRETNR